MYKRKKRQRCPDKDSAEAPHANNDFQHGSVLPKADVPDKSVESRMSERKDEASRDRQWAGLALCDCQPLSGCGETASTLKIVEGNEMSARHTMRTCKPIRLHANCILRSRDLVHLAPCSLTLDLALR